MAFLAKSAPYLEAGSTLLSASSIQRGASSDARQLRRMAGQERATSQRAGIEERRRAALLESRARAVAAGSGAGVSDPTVVKLMADIEAEGEYRALNRQYEGETAASSLEAEATQRKKNAGGQVISTLLSGGARTFASKYGS